MAGIQIETFESRVPEGNGWLVFLVKSKGTRARWGPSL